jgi:hypothetical protein
MMLVPDDVPQRILRPALLGRSADVEYLCRIRNWEPHYNALRLSFPSADSIGRYE